MSKRGMSKLEDIGKQHPFKVEEGYFDLLEKRINEKVMSKKSPGLNTWVKYAWVPAMILLVLVFNIISNDENKDYLAGISDDEIIEYLDSESLTTADIGLLLDDLDLSDLDVNQNLFFGDSLELPDESLENLLDYYDLNETI